MICTGGWQREESVSRGAPVIEGDGASIAFSSVASVVDYDPDHGARCRCPARHKFWPHLIRSYLEHVRNKVSGHLDHATLEQALTQTELEQEGFVQAGETSASTHYEFASELLVLAASHAGECARAG